MITLLYYIFSCGNDTHVGRRSRLPTEPGSCYNTADFVGESLLPNSNSPVKSPPYSSAESDDNSFKGTGVLENKSYISMCLMQLRL